MMNEPENEDLDVSPQNQPDAINAAEAAALTNVFMRVQEILAAKEGKENAIEPIVIQSNRQGKVDVKSLAEIAGGLKELQLSMAQQGDVVWWRTKSGSMGYFLVNVPYKSVGSAASRLETGSGTFHIDRSGSNSMRGDSKRESETGEGAILGASIGGMLKKDAMVKGLPVEYAIKQEGQEVPKTIRTSAVQDMGIIRNVDSGTFSAK